MKRKVTIARISAPGNKTILENGVVETNYVVMARQWKPAIAEEIFVQLTLHTGDKVLVAGEVTDWLED